MVGMRNRYSNYIFYLLASSLLFIASCSVAQTASKPNKELHTIKGYLLFAISKVDEEVIFLPDNLVNKNYNFEQLQKIKGWYLRGQNTYGIYQAKQQSKKYTVSVPILDTHDSSRSSMSIKIGVLPVILSYTTYNSVEPERDNGIPFDYKGKRYVINYIDDWDVVIEKVRVIK